MKGENEAPGSKEIKGVKRGEHAGGNERMRECSYGVMKIMKE